MNNLKLIDVLKEANTRVSAVKSFVDKVADGAALAKANKPLFDAFTEVLTFAKGDANQIRGVKVGTQNADNVLKSVDELMYALKTPNGMKAETVGLLNQGLLKAKTTPINMVDDIAKDVVAQERFIRRYGKLTDGEMKKALLAAGYSENAANSLIANAKKNPKFKAQMKKGVEMRRLKRTAGGKQKNLTPKGDGSKVSAPQKKTLLEKSKELINNINVKKMTWKQLLAWGAGIGLGAYAIWWFLFDNDVVIPDDTPETEPTDIGGEWLECIKEIVKSKEGVAIVDKSGTPVVFVKNEEYPQGLLFYTNGRVLDVASKKKGSWKCKGGVATISEQEFDGAMAQDVDTMIDYLDFPVTYSDLKNAGTLLQKYAANGKGKEFLNLYQQSGLGGGDLGKSLKNIFTTEPESVQAKAKLSTIYNNILSGKVSSSSPESPTAKVGLKNIEITWDGVKTDDGGSKVDGGNNQPRKSRFKDCNGKSLPHEFGCRSEQIKKLQGCLGVEPQLGNFGPKTKKALEALNIDTTNGITQDIIDKVCNDTTGETRRKIEKIEPISIRRNIDTSLKTPKIDMKMPNIKSIYDAGKKVYDEALNSGALFQSGGRLKYKGDYLSQTDLDELNKYLSALGWKFMKEKDKEEYDVKYVWVKA
jgi:hypothetical protein